MSAMWPRTLLVVTVTLASAGCGGDPAKRPVPPASEGVTEFAEVLRSDDPEPAYQLLSEELKQQITFEEFAAQWQKTGPERVARATTLEEELKSDAQFDEQARMVYPDGKTVYLSREDSVWLVDAAMVSRYHAGRPHDAISIFAQALADRDYEALLRILTERRREGIGKQVESFLDSLLKRMASPDNALELIGKDRAEMRWDDGTKRYKLILRREGEEWRIDDIQLQPTPIEPDEED